MGSAGVAVVFPEIPALLRVSRDIDIVPIGIPKFS